MKHPDYLHRRSLEKSENMKQTTFPIGAIFAVALYILSVHLDIWSQLPEGIRFLLGAAFILLFFSDYTQKYLKKEE